MLSSVSCVRKSMTSRFLSVKLPSEPVGKVCVSYFNISVKDETRKAKILPSTGRSHHTHALLLYVSCLRRYIILMKRRSALKQQRGTEGITCWLLLHQSMCAEVWTRRFSPQPPYHDCSGHNVSRAKTRHHVNCWCHLAEAIRVPTLPLLPTYLFTR